MWLFAAVVLTNAVAEVSAGPISAETSHLIKSIYENKESWFEANEGRHLAEQRPGPFLRRLASKTQQASCDAAFLSCLPDLNCVDCFATLETQKIDWTGITSETECSSVVKYLIDDGHCEKLENQKASTRTFCDTFNACVVWSDDSEDEVDPEDQEGFVNCTALTECKWEGMKEDWIGDGVCQDNMHGCYNTAICGYDGGDCCPDTCDDDGSKYKHCGQDGYSCRDPSSENCDSRLSAKCVNKSDEKKKADEVTCEDDEQKYRLIMYDSFGDGWDQSSVTIRKKGDSKKVFSGGLDDGNEGTEYICLSKEPSCYSAVTTGGTWGVEVSWEIKTMKEGSPAIVGSGAPSDCIFPMAGGDCEKTCHGKPTEDPTDDPDYRSFKELQKCVSSKCLIQLRTCEDDLICKECFIEEAPDYCFGVDTFNAVLDCTMCSCTDRAQSVICSKKDGPGSLFPPIDTRDNDNSAPQKCSGAETMKGAKAVIDFSECSKMEDIGIMVTEFDQSNFGQLDQFEACAHAFADKENHGGHTALGCMKILYNAMTNPVAPENDKSPPKNAIMALAKDLYQNGEAFCDCAKQSSSDCPLCPSFMNFKTLLYESLDACQALDEIDCDAWVEFASPCEENVIDKFDSVDLKMSEQCKYIKDGCGGAGTFPAFRRLDCDSEIDSDAWDFYKKYEKNCLKGNDGVPPAEEEDDDDFDAGDDDSAPDEPVPKPTRTPTDTSPTKAPAKAPTLKPYVPQDDDSVTPKPYVPDEKKNKKKGESSRGKSHWFRNLIILGFIGGAGYQLYKRRFLNQFNFMQYRRVRNFGNFGYDDDDTGGMYSNLNSSTTFEPPSLPPTPQMMGGYDQSGQQMQTFSNM